MKSTLLIPFIISFFVTNVATAHRSDIARGNDPVTLVVKSEDRSVNGSEDSTGTVANKNEQEKKDEAKKPENSEKLDRDNENGEELKDKNAGTADVQVVYRIHGAIDGNLRKQTENEMSEAMCDKEAYEDCEDIDIEVDGKHFDVISYDVLNSTNGDGSHQDRTNIDHRSERSTEVVYRKVGEPAYDRSHRIQLRERGTNQVYIATMREGEGDRDRVQNDSSPSNRTVWLSRLELSNGDAN